MPSFVCDRCQDTVKKAKLDTHKQACRNGSFSCIDCYRTFKGDEYRAHVSCITEVQKYHGKPPGKVAKVEEKKPMASQDLASSQVSIKKDGKEVPAKELRETREEDELVRFVKSILQEPSSLKEIKKTLSKKDLKKQFEKRCIFSLKDGNIFVSLDKTQ